VAYKIVLTVQAQKALKKIRNRITLEQIADVIESLAENPLMSGKPLRGSLSGYRSIRAARQRYRIIYNVIEDKIIVQVIMIGIRKGKDSDDIYQVLQRMIRTGKKPGE